jgi:HPt (histidine-containing phosphotransfer) domain-containing protein
MRDRLAELVGPDPDEEERELVGEIMASFIQRAPSALAAIEGAVQHGSAEDLHQRAHALKGSAANLGADSVAELCADIEAQGRAGTVDVAPAALDALRRELDSTCAALDGLASELVRA